MLQVHTHTQEIPVMSDDSEILKAAEELCRLLGLNAESAEALLRGELTKEQKVIKKEKVYDIADKEYTLVRTDKCTCCQTETTHIFSMRQFLKTDVLYAVEEQEMPTGKPVQTEKRNIPTCDYCLDNISLLSKRDIAAMYLELINKNAAKPELTFQEYSEFEDLYDKAVKKKRGEGE